MNTSHVDSYIVRIYQRQPGMLVGVVETDAPESCTLFHSYAELVTILARAARSQGSASPDRVGRLQ